MATALTGQQLGASGTYFDDALKIHYLPVIKEQFKKKSVLLENVKKTAKGLDTSGRFIQGAVSKSHTTGIGAKPEGYTLPTPGYEGLETFTVYMKSNYARIQVKNSASLLAKRLVRKIFSEFGGNLTEITPSQAFI